MNCAFWIQNWLKALDLSDNINTKLNTKLSNNLKKNFKPKGRHLYQEFKASAHFVYVIALKLGNMKGYRYAGRIFGKFKIYKNKNAGRSIVLRYLDILGLTSVLQWIKGTRSRWLATGM